MKTKLLITLITSLGLSHSASAHVRYTDCVVEYEGPREIKINKGKSCELKDALTIVWVTQNYPRLTQNPRRVQKWVGSYVRNDITTTTYVRELVDECRGRIIEKESYTRDSLKVNEYAIMNPNLDPNISESYMLVPMTQAEAEQELASAKTRGAAPP